MFKILIFLLPFVTFCSPETATQTAQAFCSMTDVCPARSSIACLYTKKPNLKCRGTIISPLQRLKITKWHNTIRNKVALGQVAPFSKSRRMATMQWNPQLAQMALYNVMTCKYKHDKCRSTTQFPHSGQTIYTIVNSKLSSQALVRRALKNWFQQKKNCDMSIINKFRKPKSTNYGKFTTLVKYNSNKLGCAAVQFHRHNKRVFLFTCNYASNNFVNKPIYYVGDTAIGCTTGRNVNYAGLCKINEDFSKTPNY